jgi:hypothetical protein
MTVFRDFILMWTPVGEGTTETMTGTDTGGTMNGFLTRSSTGTGRAGPIADIGKGSEPGVSRIIARSRRNSSRN